MEPGAGCRLERPAAPRRAARWPEPTQGRQRAPAVAAQAATDHEAAYSMQSTCNTAGLPSNT